MKSILNETLPHVLCLFLVQISSHQNYIFEYCFNLKLEIIKCVKGLGVVA